MDNIFKIWLAGFFDGEGCININGSGKNKNPTVRILIGNTNRDVLEKIQLVYNGDISENTTNKKKHPNWKTGYLFRISNSKAISFLKDIFPYLKIKKSQAELVFDFYKDDDYISVKQKTNNRFHDVLKPEAIERRNKINILLKEMNQRGINCIQRNKKMQS